MPILLAFLAIVSLGFGVKSQHLQEKLERERFISSRIVEQCGDEWLKKPITNQDLINFGLIEDLTNKTEIR